MLVSNVKTVLSSVLLLTGPYQIRAGIIIVESGASVLDNVTANKFTYYFRK